MFNPDELRRTFETKGEPQVRAEMADGVMSEAVAGVAARWLAAKAAETAAHRDELALAQQRILSQIRTLAYFAAVGSILSAVFSYMGFVRGH